VQFRRDALGLASNSAVSPTQDWAGRMSLDGKVAALTDQWLVITSQNKRYCIPLGALLMLELQD